jgi:CRISPR-associated protein Cmr5
MAKKPQQGGGQGRQNFQQQYKQKARDKRAAETTAAKPTVTVRQAVREASLQMVPSPSAGAQTLQQERARYALEQVKAALDSGVNGKEFKSYAASFPAMVQMNGLGQAAAFYFSQGETYRRLYDILSGWLTKENQPYEGQENLLAGITELDMHRYRIAQAEALLLLDWIKRFAKAFVREN